MICGTKGNYMSVIVAVRDEDQTLQIIEVLEKAIERFTKSTKKNI